MFNSFFKKQNDLSQIDKIDIVDEDQLDEILNLSTVKPVIIFKHSTRCGVSRIVLNQFEKKLSKSTNDPYFYFLDLIKNRSLSNRIAEKFNIIHQTPQLIVIQNKEVMAHNSHFGIMDVDF